ncbi:MAG: hypothetical protein FWF56_06280 [Firmicutes bacterium]|nr:hypothetical protein [Bacillota bacterium]
MYDKREQVMVDILKLEKRTMFITCISPILVFVVYLIVIFVSCLRWLIWGYPIILYPLAFLVPSIIILGVCCQFRIVHRKTQKILPRWLLGLMLNNIYGMAFVILSCVLRLNDLFFRKELWDILMCSYLVFVNLYLIIKKQMLYSRYKQITNNL